MTTKEAFDHIKKRIQEEEDYAWGWHCNLAMCAYDEGITHKTSNKIANRAMQMLFNVDTKEPKSLDKDWNLGEEIDIPEDKV